MTANSPDLIYGVPAWHINYSGEEVPGEAEYLMRVVFWYKGKRGVSVGFTNLHPGENPGELESYFKKVQMETLREIERGLPEATIEAD